MRKTAGLCVALALALGAAAAKPPLPAEPARTQTQDSASDTRQPLVLQLAPDPKAAEKEQRAAKKDQEDQAEKAQANVREWWMVVLTGLLTFATVLLGVFTYLLWKSTARAVKDSGNAFRVEFRPYVFMTFLRWVSLHAEGDVNTYVSWLFQMEWTNSGQSPANIVSAASNYQFFPGDVPADFAFPDNNFNTTAAPIGPKGVMYSKIPIPVEVLVDVRGGKGQLIVYGWIEYESFPGQPRHRTEYCTRILVGSNPLEPEFKLNLLFYEKFNGSDDYCFRPARQMAGD